MPAYLGFDIGSNSVGSSWVDTDRKQIAVGVSVFPAGVDESDERKRGAPLNQERRGKRQQRRLQFRRGKRKWRPKKLLAQHGLFPTQPDDIKRELDKDPWQLRRKGLVEPLTAFEFGRVLLHLAQRRGALGLKPLVRDEPQDGESANDEKDKVEPSKEDNEEKAVAAARKHTRQLMEQHLARTYGELIAILMEKSRVPTLNADGTHKATTYQSRPVRNRLNLLVDHPEAAVYADRDFVREEFNRLWDKQKSFPGDLSEKLTDELKVQLDDPDLKRFDHDPTRKERYAKTWRHGGELFGQRRTYWNMGTLGRCVLEPTDQRCPLADMDAQEFRVLETVNNIRLRNRGESEWKPLNDEQRSRVLDYLRGRAVSPLSLQTKKKPAAAKSAPISIEPKHIRWVLGIDQKTLSKINIPAELFELNLERDADRELNTDWFSRKLVHHVFTELRWQELTSKNHRFPESVNGALLKFDPAESKDETKLREGAKKWWELSAEELERFIETWQSRPKLEKRLKRSRRAIKNLLPYMRQRREQDGQQFWPTEIEARQLFAEDPNAKDATTGEPASNLQRVRYAHDFTPELRQLLLASVAGDGLALQEQLRQRDTTKADRRYLRKHSQTKSGKPKLTLPPAPMLSNPVVRKAIHEVRRHVLSYYHKFGRKPDRIVIELARSAKQPEKVRNARLKLNRHRNKEREKIGKQLIEWGLSQLSLRQREAAIDRVLLCRQQRGFCPYSGLLEENGCECPYSGKPITERMAAGGEGLELDHIVPESWGGSDGLNNRVLCFSGANRGKSDKPPKTWLSTSAFEALEARLLHFEQIGKEKRWDEKDYFTPKDYAAKWDNLHRETRPDDWSKSQLTDTAYAAREVAAYLQSALFANDGQQRIFFTKGSYTFLLRKDWALFQRLKPPGWELDQLADADSEKALAQKDRSDHRHHAIDAVCIALTQPDLLQQLSRDAADRERAKAEAEERSDESVRWPKRKKIPPPWGSVSEFRREVLGQVFAEFDTSDDWGKKSEGSETGTPLIVCHRPVKRRIAGALHQDSPYGPVVLPDGTMSEDESTGRINVTDLTPNHLRKWHFETDDEAIDRLSRRFQKQLKLTAPAAKKRAKTVVESPSFKFRKRKRRIDPPPTPSGLVRDQALRDRIRLCLEDERNGKLNPDDRTKTGNDFNLTLKIRKLAMEGKLWMCHASGVPIKSAVKLNTTNEPVVIQGRVRDPETGKLVLPPTQTPDEQKLAVRLTRIYIGGNNHHVEIRENVQTGEWKGDFVTMFEAAKRNAAQLKATRDFRNQLRELRSNNLPRDDFLQRRQQLRQQIRDANERTPIVNRQNDDQWRFVMSLSQGEMVKMRHKETRELDFFVVTQVNKPRNEIHFARHSYARKKGAEKADEKLSRFAASAAQMRDLGEDADHPPYKVHVTPLGKPVVFTD